MLLLWLLVSCTLQQMWLEKAGTNGAFYEVIIDSFEPDPNYDKTSIILNSIRVTRKSRNNFVVSGDFELLQNWGNENTVHFAVTNSLGVMVFRGRKPFCEIFNSKWSIIQKVRECSNIPPGNYCPVVKGKYEVVNYNIQEEDLPLVVMKDTYTVRAQVIAPDGRMLFAYKSNLSVI